MIGSLSEYLASAWSLTGGLDSYLIHFPGTVNEDWYEERLLNRKQISITQLVSPRIGQYSSGQVMSASFLSRFEVNVWVPIRPGADGSAEADQAIVMCEEVARVFLKGHPNYGGSLTPFGGVFPITQGRPMTLEVEEHTPMLLRYQLLIEATRHR
jgi:hypothetical protein